MTYRNLRSYPVKSGTGVLRETVDVPAIERIGSDLLAQMDWHGVAEVDFRWDGGEGQPWLIEVNPRFWGGLTQAVETGYDYPHLLYQLAVRGHVDPHDALRVRVVARAKSAGQDGDHVLEEVVVEEAAGGGIDAAERDHVDIGLDVLPRFRNLDNDTMAIANGRSDRQLGKPLPDVACPVFQVTKFQWR
jgi:hypothetical protein